MLDNVIYHTSPQFSTNQFCEIPGIHLYSKTCVKQLLSKRQKIGFQDQLLLNAGQKHYRMLTVEHSVILLTFIKLPFVFKIYLFLSGCFTQILL